MAKEAYMNEKRPGCQGFSITFLVLSALAYFIFIIVCVGFMSALSFSKEISPEEEKTLFYGLSILCTALLTVSFGTFGIILGFIGAIFGCLGAIFSCFNLHCEEKKMRNRARVLVAVNGILAFIFPVFYLAAQHNFSGFLN